MRTQSTSSEQSRGSPPPTFAIVGVGASAGGLEAFRQLLAHVPDQSGLAFVLVQHLEATRASQLSDALATSTTMRVAQAEDGVRVEPDHVYVIPPGTQMTIEGGVLRLSPLGGDERRPTLPIDHFFHSLAADRGRQAIGVVLSGNASDGTAGLTAIRENGGITFAQDPRSARVGTMPRSAIDAGVVDFCLPLPAMGTELGRLSRHPYLARGEPVPPTPAGATSLAEVIAIVRTGTGVDFGEHKQATFKRRLARRMVVRKAKDLAAYLELLREDPAETRLLYDDLLIKVTSFFRDEHGFDELKAVAFPAILKDKAPGSPVRAWVVGCATGEEVYSLAISLIEHLGDNPEGHPILIFGSDLDEKAIERARTGLYPDSAVQHMGEERLKRFFVRTERGWSVSKAVRELCVFVRHDVARNPPFSRLDLVTCRNVLIYFGLALQRRVIAAAHYCLNQPGFLLLGPTEGTAGLGKWFTLASKGEGLFSRKPGRSTFRFAPRAGSIPFARLTSSAEGVPLPRTETSLARQADGAVLDRYGPPGVVVNDRMEVVQFRGRTGPYLEPPVGEPQSQLLKMARIRPRRPAPHRHRPGAPHVRGGAQGERPDRRGRRRPGLQSRGAPGAGERWRRGGIRGAVRGASADREAARAGQVPGSRQRERGGGEPGARGRAHLHEGVRRGASRGAGSRHRRARLRQRRAGFRQRGAPEPERGAGDGQGGAPGHQRGAHHRQRRAERAERRAPGGQRRRPEPPRCGRDPHRDARRGSPHSPLHAAGLELPRAHAGRRGQAGQRGGSSRSSRQTSSPG